MKNTAVFLLSLLMYHSTSYASITPTDVYHQANLVQTQITALKEKYSAKFKPRIPGIQIGKTPLHAYGKGLELLEKIQRYQEQHEMTQLVLPQLPSNPVKPADVLALLQEAQAQLTELLADGGISVDLGSVPLQSLTRTPSDVYEKIWQASYTMDALVEPIKPADVMRNTNMIEEALLAIAKKRGLQLSFPSPQKFTSKKPVDVNLQYYKLLYKVASLERKLQLKPLIVPSFPAGKIKPEDTYDSTGNILADLTRIAIKLNIPAVKRQTVPSGRITPNDVYAQIFRLNSGAQQLVD